MLMSWENSQRKQDLPPNWQALRAAVQQRAGNRCEAALNDGARCPAPGTDCDHITRGNNHDLSNLQWLCSWHHKRKTRKEALQALKQQSARNQPPPKPHPGLA